MPPKDPDRGSGLRALLAAAGEEWRATPLYRLTLNGPDLDRIALWGVDPRIGDPERGAEILAGRWRFGADKLAGTWPVPWAAPAPPTFTARLHAFGWLRDLAAVGGQADQAIAAILQAWLVQYGEWDAIAWSPDLTAERLTAWLCWGRAAHDGGDLGLRPALLRAFARQARHLERSMDDVRPALRVKAAAALVLAGAAMAPERDRFIGRGLATLERCLDTDFTADGLHLSRSPEGTLDALADVETALAALRGAGIEPPETLAAGLARSADLLAFLRLSDGALPSFHGGGASDAARVQALLGPRSTGRTFRIAPASGFYRLAAGETALVMDAGEAPPPAFGDRAHAGCLAFEMSCGRDRLIVNVGSGENVNPEWRAAGRGTAGHSTLTLDEALSATFVSSRGAARPVGPPEVSARRTDDEDGARVEARHGGYRAAYGLVHERTLFLDPAGVRVIGVDRLFRPSQERRPVDLYRPPYAIRFHLDPRVKVDQRGDRDIRLETAGGAHWAMRSDAAQTLVEESVRLVGDGAPRRTAQVVLAGEADPGGAGDQKPNRVIWTLTRLDKPL